MFAFLAPYKLLIEIAIIGSLIGGAVWGVHSFLNHEQQLGYDRAVEEYAIKEAQAKEASLKTERDLRKQLEDAQNAANERGQAIAAATAAANSSAGSLRDALGHIRDGVPSATAASLAQSVTTLTTIFGDCTNRYTELAAKADRHASDARTLYEAWPKVKEQK